MKTSVLHIVQHLRPGGLETLVLEMQEKDPACHVVSLEGEASEALGSWPRLFSVEDRLHFLNKPMGLDIRTLFRLTGLIRRLAPAVVHTHHIGPLLYGGLAARMARCPKLVHTEHDAWHLESSRRAALMKRLTTLLAPRMIADADAVAAQLFDRCGIQSRTIRNGIDTCKFNTVSRVAARNALGLPTDGVVIGTAGRMEPVKNQALLLRAFAELDQDGSLCLTLAGDGTCRSDLESLSRELGIERNVRFLGRVDRMPEFLNALDLFILPSDKEGYPLSLLEAQSCGTPVIATNVGGSRDAVCTRTGAVVEPGNAKAMVDAIRDFLSHGRAGDPREFVVREGSLHAMISQYHAVYQN